MTSTLTTGQINSKQDMIIHMSFIALRLRLRRWAGRLGRVTAFLALAIVGLAVALVRGL